MTTPKSQLSTSDFAGRGTAESPHAQGVDEETAQTPLFQTHDADGFQTRWQDIQARFVDEPRESVEQADGLVAELMQRLAHEFAQERQNLEAQWAEGENADTEQLRVALRRYRSFFQRLLST
jgi:hypothetical protein